MKTKDLYSTLRYAAGCVLVSVVAFVGDGCSMEMSDSDSHEVTNSSLHEITNNAEMLATLKANIEKLKKYERFNDKIEDITAKKDAFAHKVARSNDEQMSDADLKDLKLLTHFVRESAETCKEISELDAGFENFTYGGRVLPFNLKSALMDRIPDLRTLGEITEGHLDKMFIFISNTAYELMPVLSLMEDSPLKSVMMDTFYKNAPLYKKEWTFKDVTQEQELAMDRMWKAKHQYEQIIGRNIGRKNRRLEETIRKCLLPLLLSLKLDPNAKDLGRYSDTLTNWEFLQHLEIVTRLQTLMRNQPKIINEDDRKIIHSMTCEEMMDPKNKEAMSMLLNKISSCYGGEYLSFATTVEEDQLRRQQHEETSC